MRRFLPVIFLLLHMVCQAQTQTVSGRVASATEPNGLPGVNVVVKGSSNGAITDLEGRFTLSVSPGDVLVFSFVGYVPQEVAYAGQTQLDVTLVEESKQLEEVVVMGYTAMEKREITGAVATVKTDNLAKLSISSLDQGLTGMAPGVQVTQSSGTPGGGVSVHIRGATSIGASNTPLYIVDGIPVGTGALSDRDFGGQNDNALALINPNDIASITILKDASAKALYGSRASNGVVVITTKRGKGQAKITVDAQHGIIDPVHRLSLLNSSQLLQLQREAVQNAGQNPDALGLIPGVTDAVNTDWQKQVLRQAQMQQYQVTASGGDNNTTYYISANYRNEEGIQINNKFERLGTTINLDQKLNDKFTLGTNLTLSRGFNKRVKGDNFLDGVYSGAIKSLPYNTPYDENGALVGPSSPLYAGFPNFNPVAQALLPRFNTLSVKILGNINAAYQLTKDLKLTGKVALDYNDVKEDQYESSQTAIGGYLESVGGAGYGVYSATSSARVISNATLTYTKQLSQNQNLSAIAGTELLQDNSQGGNLQGRLFPSDDFTYIQSAGIVDAGSSFKTPKHSIVSYFADVRYDFADKYLLSASFRADASSNFGPNNKVGYFPALSAGWRISNEKFFHSNVVSDLKLRASLGYTGNERIGAFSYLATWTASTYNGSSGVVPSSTNNPNVKWETTRETNVGVDIALWEGRIQSSIDAYYNKTTDLLLTRPYPLTTGFGGIPDNVGSLENKGIEFTATSYNLNGALKWNTTLNLSKNLNKVLALADSLPIFTGYTGEGVDGTNVVMKGQPLGTFWGLNYQGVDPATGNAIYEDRNKDGLITNADAMVIGNSQPKWIGGITNTFSYGNFDLSFFFQFSYGNKVLNFTKASIVNMGADVLTDQSTDALRRWQKPGDITDIPKYSLGSTKNNLHSNRLLEDASYLRLKNLNIGYRLSPQMAGKLMLSQLRVYLTATNLWTFTKYTGSDPEVSTLDGSTASQGIDFFTLPQVRTISVGLNATLR